MASLKDVAALAGVSVSTVSRVINRNTPVEPDTREKVEKAIQKLEYRPNLLAKGLRDGSGKMIGFVVPETMHPTFSRFLQYVGDYCYAKGYSLVVGSHHNDPSIEEQLIDSFYRRNIDGLILSLVSDESRALSMIYRSPVPTVIIDRVTSGGRHNSVTTDNHMAGYIMAEHFISLGHKKIGCVTGPMSISLSRERLQGFRDALSAHGLSLEDRFVAEGTFDISAGFHAARKIFSNLNDRPTAIWGQSDDIAAGILKYVSTAGISVPKDLSLAGMDDNELASALTPSLTTIAQPIELMSENAVDLIINNAAREELIVVAPGLVQRKSTALRSD